MVAGRHSGKRALLALAFAATVVAQDTECGANGFVARTEFTGVFLDFGNSVVTCNRLGGYTPEPGEPGATPACTVDEIRYTDIGTDFGTTPGAADNTQVDLVVRNTSGYIPNNVLRNGRTELQQGLFGQVNMADDQLTSFTYDFVERGTNIPVVFSTPFNFFFYDIDVGEAGRLSEVITVEGALSVTDIEDACADRNQPSPCLSGSVIIQNQGGNRFTCLGTERGYGNDNAENPLQVLQPVADMTDFDKVAARKYVNVSYPAGISGFAVEYSLTPSADPGFSGRNFQYSILGLGIVNSIQLPCYYCESPDCAACGGDSPIPCPPLTDGGAFLADCAEAANLACVQGDASYPACLTQCAIDCEAGCTEYVCFKPLGQCVECGSAVCALGSACYTANCEQGTGFATLDSCEAAECDEWVCDLGGAGECVECGTPSCAFGTACYTDNCDKGTGFETEESCVAAGCTEYVCNDYECLQCGSEECAESTDPDSCFVKFCNKNVGFPNAEECFESGCEKVVCEAEVTQMCYDCKSDYIRSLVGPGDDSYCDGKTLYNKIGFNCRTACNPPVARKDPHLYLPHGGRADFRGANNVTFAMLSAKDVAFNVKFEQADFNWAKRVVHGTKMAAAYWTIRTSTGKMLKIEYNASSKLGGVVHEEGKRDVTIMANAPALVIDNVHVSLESQKLTVEVGGKWLLSAAVASFPFGNLAANKNKKLLDIGVEALYDADHDVVAPHGIFGQAYDGDNLGVSGKMDKDKAVESSTEAQAEGAIEGTWIDYTVSSPFATAFKFSRFDATEAKPRDVSKLTGAKTPMPTAGYKVGASDVPEVA